MAQYTLGAAQRGMARGECHIHVGDMPGGGQHEGVCLQRWCLDKSLALRNGP